MWTVAVEVVGLIRVGPRLLEYCVGAGLAGSVAGLLVDVEGAARMLDCGGVVALGEVDLRDQCQRLALKHTEFTCAGEIECGVGVA